MLAGGGLEKFKQAFMFSLAVYISIKGVTYTCYM